ELTIVRLASAQRLLRQFAFMNVGGRPDPSHDAALLILDGNGAVNKPAVNPVVSPETALGFIRLAPPQGFRPSLAQLGQVFWMMNIVHRNQIRLLQSQPCVLGPAAVDVV